MADTSGIRCLIVAPVDLLERRAGGIQSFVEGFVKFAPPDFDFEVVGIRRGRPDKVHDPGWRSVYVAGRQVRLLSVLMTDVGHGRSLVPLSLRFAWALFRLRTMIDTHGRVLQFHRPGTALPFLRAAAPRVHVIHYDLAQMSGRTGENRWRRFPGLLRLTDSLSLRRASAIVTVNEATAVSYAARRPEIADRVSFVPNWWDPTIFGRVAPDARATIRDRLMVLLGAAPDDRLVLSVGRLETTKDPALALETMRHSARRAHLVFLGDGSLRQKMQRLARESGLDGRVHFIGTLPQEGVADWMRAADALIVSSHSEAGPTSALEALGCGLPVVGTTVGRLPQLLHHGETGWLVPSRSAVDLAVGIDWASSLAGRPETACAEAAAPYQADRVLQPLFELHRELLQRAGNHP